MAAHPRAIAEVHTAHALDLLRKFLLTLGYLVQSMRPRDAVRRKETFTLDFR